MEENANSSINLFSIAGWVEKLMILGITIGLALNYLNTPESNDVLSIGFVGLAISLFITAYKPKEIFTSQEEADQFGDFKLSDLIRLIIIPKILWLASGVSAFGIFLYLVDLGNDGYIKIIGIGGLSISLAFLILLGTLITGTKKLNTVVPALMRSIPMVIADAYILFV